jgi:hypothetical protein
MIGFDEQKKLFNLIGNQCRREMKAVIVGGSAMLFYNFSKAITKDIDVVLLSEEDRKYLIRILKKTGFVVENRPKKNNEPYKLVFKDYILDVFAKDVFRLKISEGILRRMKEDIRFGSLTISILSPEDIILSKSMTDRAGDREDAALIINETNVKWDNIINECVWQSKNGDFRFCVYLYDFLDDLVHDFGITLPADVIRKIKRMHKEFMDNIEVK